jgi:hypothetical protein
MNASSRSQDDHQAGSATDLAAQNLPTPPGTSLDLPPCFINMSPVEPAYREIAERYGRSVR